MTVILFKGYFLQRCLIWLYSIGIVLSISIFLFLHFAMEFRYLLSMIVIFSGILIVFYINRFEPASLKISKENIEINFFNKAFFKKPRAVYSTSQTSFFLEDNKIKLCIDGNTIAIIRKQSLEDDLDWQILKDYFSH